MTDVPLFRRRRHVALVIEDDPANRKPLSGALTREPHTVWSAADGGRDLIAAPDPNLDPTLLAAARVGPD